METGGLIGQCGDVKIVVDGTGQEGGGPYVGQCGGGGIGLDIGGLWGGDIGGLWGGDIGGLSGTHHAGVDDAKANVIVDEMAYPATPVPMSPANTTAEIRADFTRMTASRQPSIPSPVRSAVTLVPYPAADNRVQPSTWPGRSAQIDCT